jgi:hypothetical protein
LGNGLNVFSGAKKPKGIINIAILLDNQRWKTYRRFSPTMEKPSMFCAR